MSTCGALNLVHVETVCSAQHFLTSFPPPPSFRCPLVPSRTTSLPLGRENCVLSQAWVLLHFLVASTASRWVPCTLVLEPKQVLRCLSPTTQAFHPEGRAECADGLWGRCLQSCQSREPLALRSLEENFRVGKRPDLVLLRFEGHGTLVSWVLVHVGDVTANWAPILHILCAPGFWV